MQVLFPISTNYHFSERIMLGAGIRPGGSQHSVLISLIPTAPAMAFLTAPSLDTREAGWARGRTWEAWVHLGFVPVGSIHCFCQPHVSSPSKHLCYWLNLHQPTPDTSLQLHRKGLLPPPSRSLPGAWNILRPGKHKRTLMMPFKATVACGFVVSDSCDTRKG